MTGAARLIRAPELLDRLGDPDLVVLDVRVRYENETAVADHEQFLRGHIPDAVFADVVTRLSDGAAERAFTLPSPADFSREIGELGVGDGKHVVVYGQGWPIWATRVWWLLRYHGFDDVQLLDGGWQGWVGAGNPVQKGISRSTPQHFVSRVRRQLLASLADVEDVVAGRQNQLLVNALPVEMFTGEVATHGTVHGRIPGSVSLPWPQAADLDSGVYHDPQVIAAAAAALPAEAPLVAYCGGGVSATALIFGLALAGRDDVKLYDGSMDEWAADPTRPLERDVDIPTP